MLPWICRDAIELFAATLMVIITPIILTTIGAAYLLILPFGLLLLCEYLPVVFITTPVFISTPVFIQFISRKIVFQLHIRTASFSWSIDEHSCNFSVPFWYLWWGVYSYYEVLVIQSVKPGFLASCDVESVGMSE